MYGRLKTGFRYRVFGNGGENVAWSGRFTGILPAWERAVCRRRGLAPVTCLGIVRLLPWHLVMAGKLGLTSWCGQLFVSPVVESGVMKFQ